MPNRLASYLLRETAGLYLLGVAAFCLLLSIDFLTVWAQFLIEQNAAPATIGRLMLLKLPWFLHLSLPIAVVFAVLLATGRLARDSELKAAYALGAAPLTLLLPLVLAGLLVSAATLVNNSVLEPLAERSYDRLVNAFFYTRPPAEVQSNASFVIPDGGVYFAARIRAQLEDPGRANLSGALVIQDDGTTYIAPSGVWDSGRRIWTLVDSERVPRGGAPESVGTVSLPFELEGNAEQTLAKSETLTLPALQRQLQSVTAAGGNVRPLRFELHRRLADALSATIFVLVAGTLGLQLRSRSAGFAWTIVLLVVFWALWELSASFFTTGVLGPLAAAWLTPAVVGLGGVALALWRLRA